jgi:hypothetical protein
VYNGWYVKPTILSNYWSELEFIRIADWCASLLEMVLSYPLFSGTLPHPKSSEFVSLSKAQFKFVGSNEVMVCQNLVK